MKRKRICNILINNTLAYCGGVVDQFNRRLSLHGKGGLRLFFITSVLIILQLFININAYSQGYTTPADANSNGIYDFQEAGSAPVIAEQPQDSAICENASAEFIVSATGEALTYQWMVSTDGGSTFNNITTAGTDPTYSGFGTSTLSLSGAQLSNDAYQYQVVVYSGTFACDSTISNVALIQVASTPSAPTAATNQDFCTSESHLVSDLTATGTGLQWYDAATGGSVYAPATTLTNGSYFVSQTVGSCESARTEVVVTINATPSAPTAAANQDFCTSESHLVSNLTATGTGLQWYDAATGGSVYAPATTLTNGSYFVSQTVGSCESARTEVVVTVTTTPTAPTAATNEFCSNTNPKVLDLTPNGPNFSWYTDSIGGSPLNSTTDINISEDYFVSQTIGGCESERTYVWVKITATPGTPTASDHEFCIADNPQVGQLTVTSGTDPKWYLNATGGTALNNTTSLTTGTYYVTQTVDGCESFRLAVDVTVHGFTPLPTTSSPQSFCTGSSSMISDIEVTGDSLRWYNGATGGVELDTTEVLVTGSYFVTQTLNICESDRLEIEVVLEDNEDPVVTCNPFTLQLDNTGNATLLTSDILNTVSDNCSTPTLSLSQTGFDCSDRGTVSITLTAEDNDGNTGSCFANVLVQDVTDPIAVCADVDLFLDVDGNGSVNASAVDNGSTDACTTLNFALNITDFSCADVGANPVILTVSDDSGNSSTCDAEVNVYDNIDPVANCQDTTIYLDAGGNASIVATDVDDSSTDACGVASLVANPLNFTTAELGTNNVTLVVTDNSGNTSNCVAVVTVLDGTPPEALCQDTTIYLDNAGSATLSVSAVDAGSSDNDGIASISLSQTDYTCSNIGTSEVYLIAEDNAGNVDSCSAIITVLDTISPVVTCVDTTIYLDDSGVATADYDDFVTSRTDNCGTPAYALTGVSFSCANVGLGNVATITANDASGNIGTCSASITVLDTIGPNAVCQDITIALDVNGEATITTADIDNGSNDSCGVSSVSLTNTFFNTDHLGANNDTLILTDVNGNTSFCVGIVTVEDNESPNAVCNDTTLYLDGSGVVSIIDEDLDGGSTDNSGIASIVADQTSFDCSDLGTNNIGLTVTDVSGNVSVCDAQVIIVDDISPVALCDTLTIYLDETGIANITPGQVGGASTDNCGAPTLTISGSQFDCTNIPSTTITLTATDASGNFSTCSAVIYPIDTINPTPACLNITVPLGGSGEASFTASDIDGGSYDACGIDSLSANITTFDVSHLGPNDVVLTVVDNYGNDSTCIAVVTVSDSNPPTAVCSDTTLYLNESGLSSILAEELDGGSTDNGSIDSYTASQTNFECLDLGDNNITLTIEDDGGNTNSCIAVVTILDSIAPTVTCRDTLVQLNATGDVTIDSSYLVNTSDDNCSIVDVVLDVEDFTCADHGVNSVMVMVTDQSGNNGNCTSTVTIENYPWTAVCQDITVNLDVNGEATILATQLDGGTDVTCGASNIFASQTDFTNADLGNNNVTLYVEDNYGRIDSCIAVVTVTDTNAPTAICQDLTIYLDDAGDASITPEEVNNNSTDNGSIVDLRLDINSFDCSSLGGNNVVLEVEDDAGNVSTCDAIINVLDSISPELVCQTDTIYLDSFGDATLIPSNVIQGSTDNCGVDSIAVTQVDFDCSNLGDNAVTVTAFDVSGNPAACEANVHVVDDIDPEIVCEDISVQLDESSIASIIASQVGANNASDNCEVADVILDTYDFDASNIGLNDVLVTVTDNSGNSFSCTAEVTITDGNAPTPVCIGDTTLYLDNSGLASITAEDLDGGSTDNGSIVNWGATQTSFECSDAGNNIVTLTLEDNSGNTATCDVNVLVTDSISPIVSCQDTVEVFLNDAGQAFVSGGQVVTGSSDNCGVSGMSIDPTNFNNEDLFEDIPVTAVVTDQFGNQGSCVSIVNVIDTIAPTISCIDLTVSLDADGLVSVSENELDDIGYDNDVIFYTTQNLNFTCADIGDNTYTIEAFDMSLNTSSCSGTITVVDDMAPTTLCQDFTLNLDEFNQGTLTIADIDNGTTDNCGIDSLSLSQYNFDETDIGSTEVILTAVDIYGNTSSCTANVQVNSTLPPEAICQDITVSLDATSNVMIIAEDIDNGSNDANGSVSLTLSQDEFTCDHLGDNVVTLTVENQLDVTATCDATVTVVDDITPVINCPSDVTIDNDLGSCGAVYDYGNLVANDNCVADITLDMGPATNSYFELGTTDIQYTATDASGNSSQCAFSVTVIDSEKPVIECPESIFVIDPIVHFGAPVFNDNCSADLLQIDGLTSGSEFPHGITAITFMATDISGLSEECSFDIVVNNPVVAVNDSVMSIENSGGIVIDPLVNDYDVDGDEISIVSVSSNNGVVMIQGDNLTYIPPNDWCGQDTIVYTVTDGFGQEVSALIFVDVSCGISLFVPEGFSPNNDGINDYFEIIGIEDYPESVLNVYNRWSHLVFEAKEYDNTWDGTITNPLTFGKKQLPHGTYFYSLKLDDDHDVIKGYFYISTK